MTLAAPGVPTGAPGAYRTEPLATTPGLGGLYARGAASSGTIAARRVLPGETPEPALPAVALRVEDVPTGPEVAARLAAYQRLVGERVGDALPAGFLHVLAFPVATALMVRGDFPLPLLGMVHVANAVTLARPVALGQLLTVDAWAQDLRPHRRGVTVDLVTEVRADGEGAYRGVSTYLARGVSLEATGTDGAEGTAGAHDAQEPAGSRPGFVPPLPTGRWRLPAGTGRAYAAVSGDRNPIHLSALSAKAFGFPRAVAHGMYTAARALAEVGTARGAAYDWTVRFAHPVLLPGTVDVAITPAADGAGDGHEYVGWDAWRARRHFAGTVVPR
ncbi:MaoC/PaaZ C-terminal domain-containing protein [Cellulomonas sp. PhB143]|uniref:MaoC family dehydratase n=1 Tax=Cellulomonas sp. PhB143 TaxID=2485186 RepID=UPI000F49D955|nr:MaoC/PaaZ C-terminal domain-containing protein [Cellulomonas sp. PhB143]ROS76516.1 MaoC dehydratase-like protein [Cellulomonas sp. PhB143]